jgi:hypothetical protein
VCGMRMSVCERPRQSCTIFTSEGLVWVSGLKLFRVFTVISPTQAVPQKVVVRQANTVMLKPELERSKCSCSL